MPGTSRFKFFRINSICHLVPRLFLIVILHIYLHLIIDVKSLPISSLEDYRDLSTEDGEEYELDDIIPNPSDGIGRSRLISMRWPKRGMVMFYPVDHFNKRQICYMERAVQFISTFSCIPIYLIQLNGRCTKEEDILQCVLETENPGGNTYQRMVEAGAPTNLNDYDGYIVIKFKTACSSYLGRLGGKQIITFRASCFSKGAGVVIHEMLHALGYAHEHTRLDRDQYVKINFTNIKKVGIGSFNKQTSKFFTDFGPYDYQSLMHYAAHDFAIDTNYPTIIPKMKPEGVEIGQRALMTFGDKVKIRSVTHCPGNTYEDHSIAIKNLPTREFHEHTLVVAPECLNVSTEYDTEWFTFSKKRRRFQ